MTSVEILPNHLRSLHLPPHNLLRLFTGEVRYIADGHWQAVRGGAIWGVPDQKKWIKILDPHSLLVGRVGPELATLLNYVHKNDSSWKPLDVEFIGQVGLIEDFAKRYEKEAPPGVIDHVQAAVPILEQSDLLRKDEMIHLLKIHLYGMTGYDQEPKTWTEKVLILADHYCTGKIVSQAERNSDFEKRQQVGGTMPTTDQEHSKVVNSRAKYQKELLTELNMTEDELVAHLQQLPVSLAEAKLRELFARPYVQVNRILPAISRMQSLQVKEAELRNQRNTVIFDFGKVLMDYDDETWYRKMADKSGLEIDQIREFISKTETDRMIGSLSDIAACDLIKEIYGVQVDPDTFFEIDMKLRPDMIELVNDLLVRGKQVAILTNTIPTHLKRVKQLLKEACPELAEKNIFASCELGMRKTGVKNTDPHKEDIFQVVLNRLGISAEEAIYIDDNQGYASQARQYITTFRLDAGDKFIKELVYQALGIK